MSLYDITGKEVSSLEVPHEIFLSNINERLLATYVRVYLTNQRQGTAATKTRSEVAASTRKIYRQKGTGRARHGARSANVFAGGGVVFGPRPKEYKLSLNKKQKRKALFDALSYSFKKHNIIALSDKTKIIKPKTKQITLFIKSLSIKDKNILFVLAKMEKNNLVLSMRNISGLTITDALSLNAYEVLKANHIIFQEKALDTLANHFLKKHEN